MLSRVAHSIWWIARYMERTNGLLRLLRTTYTLSQDEKIESGWRPLVRLYGNLTGESLEQMHEQTGKILEHLVLDTDNDASVTNNIFRARENARAVQDHITKEVWQCLNDFYHLMRDERLHQQLVHGDPISAFDSLIQHSMLYQGTIDLTMARGEGFNYLTIGKYLERAIISADILNLRLDDLKDNAGAESMTMRYLLYALSGYELYMKSYRGRFEPEYVVEQIIYDNQFPHSVLFSLQELALCFEELKSQSLLESYEQVEFYIGRTMNNVKYSNKTKSKKEEIRKFLLQTKYEMFEISDAMNQYYFGNN